MAGSIVNRLCLLGFLASQGGDGAALRAEMTRLSLNEIVAGMERADHARRAAFPRYSDTRHYIFSNERSTNSSEMTVRSQHQVGESTEFVVLGNRGAEGLSGRVFRHILDAEREASRQGNTGIDSRNYTFELLGTETIHGRECYKLRLNAIKKRKYLLDGVAWIDARDFGFVRIVGQPAANLSFWVGRPTMTMDFAKVGGYWLIARNCSQAHARIIGDTELTIEYGDYVVQNAVDVALLGEHHQR